MKAIIKEYPQNNKRGFLVIETLSNKPVIRNRGYNVYDHPDVTIYINEDKLPEQRTKEMYFTTYTLPSGEKVNTGGTTEIIYTDNKTTVLHGSYNNGILKLY